jgi:hypothetical protein
MTKVINDIVNKDFTSAKTAINEKLEAIAERKMLEMKKMVQAKMTEQEHDFIIKQQANDRRERLKRGITEETQIDESDSKESLQAALKHWQAMHIRADYTDNTAKRDSEKAEAERNIAHFTKRLKELDEETNPNIQKQGRAKLIKIRVRGGKIQRRKKVSSVPGLTFRGGKLIRMSPAERRHRKLGARKAKFKRRSKKAMILRKRKMSMAKRHRLGL